MGVGLVKEREMSKPEKLTILSDDELRAALLREKKRLETEMGLKTSLSSVARAAILRGLRLEGTAR